MKKFLSLGIVIAIVLGFIFQIDPKYKFLVPLVLAFIMFFNFLKVEFEWKKFIRWELIITILSIFVVIPVLVWLITWRVETQIRLGLMLIAITPSAIASPVIVSILNGDTSLAIANTVVTNLMSPFIYPAMLMLLYSGEEVSVDGLQILIKLLLLIGLPFILAQVVKVFKKIHDTLEKAVTVVNLLYIAIVFIAVSTSSSHFNLDSPLQLMLVIALSGMIAILLYLIGFISGRSKEGRMTMAVCNGQKNTALCVWLVIAHFPGPAVLPCIIYIIMHHMINAVMIFYSSHRKRD
jgi:predicted Na+-dependent transporter